VHRASGIGHRASGIGHRALGIGHRALGIGHRAYLTTRSNRYIESLIFNGLFMKFGALKLGKNTVIKTASHTATLLNVYKKIVFFKI